MVQVSKNPLGKETSEEIQSALWWLLARIRDDKEIKNFLNGFLTKTEKIMLAKRLAMMFLINKNYNYHDISEALKVSTDTIYRIKNKLDEYGEEFVGFIKRLERKEELKKFEKQFQKIIEGLDNFVPPQKNDMKGRAKMWRI